MIENICLLLEALAMVICLHYLYGEKFKLNIVNTSYLAVHMIILTVINYYKLPNSVSLIIYPTMALYCGIRFGFKWKEIIINNILYMLIVGGMQLIFIMCYGWFFNSFSINILEFENRELFMTNVSVLLAELLGLSKFKIKRLSVYLQDKERILTIFLIFSMILIASCFINYKILKGLKVYQYLVIFAGISLVCLLAGQLGKYKIKSKEIETELKMNKLYADSFYSLIEDIRMRQHEFDNHISAIYSLHYTCNSYEQLVGAQNEYSQVVIKENRYNRLLKAGNPLIIGFLYGKFVEAERQKVDVIYQINVSDLKVGVPVYKLVEILGNLIKNAMEAMENLEEPKVLYVEVIENAGEIGIEVRNKSEFIEYDKIETFFRKGYSKKGNNRGLGLYNVKNICSEYSLNILCENKILNEENWISFIVNNKKEAI